MRIFYPYNEIIPKKTAHDVFIIHQCEALAKEGAEISLLCGSGSWVDKQLFDHYQITAPFEIKRLPIIRKNNPFNISWNRPFFHFAQRAIQRSKPDAVFLSVLKQGEYHLRRKCKWTRYIYEAHQLGFYPNGSIDKPLVEREKNMLSHADLVTVTTAAMKEILTRPPYSLTVPIEVIPLAVRTTPLSSPSESEPTLMYIGQLYEGQGLPLLLRALAQTRRWKLKIVGGKPLEITNLRSLASRLGITERVEFLGFQPPSALREIAETAHGFVAPFEARERMPYVAHTKLYEYAMWGRPMVVPQLPSVCEDFSEESGALFFEPGSVGSLAECLQNLEEPSLRQQLQKKIEKLSGNFSWQKRASHYLRLLESISDARKCTKETIS